MMNWRDVLLALLSAVVWADACANRHRPMDKQEINKGCGFHIHLLYKYVDLAARGFDKLRQSRVASRERQYFITGWCDQNRMFPLSRQTAVFGFYRPSHRTWCANRVCLR